MEKTKKAQAIKKLETELKDEKQAEFLRCVAVLMYFRFYTNELYWKTERSYNGAQKGRRRANKTRGSKGEGMRTL